MSEGLSDVIMLFFNHFFSNNKQHIKTLFIIHYSSTPGHLLVIKFFCYLIADEKMSKNNYNIVNTMAQNMCLAYQYVM